ADQLWFVVNRIIDGVQTGFIEVLDPTINAGNPIVAGDSASSATFSPATNVVTGLGYLFGRTVWLNGDGAVYGPYTIDATGQITLPAGLTAANIQVALPSCSQIVTVRPEIQGGQTIQ